MAAPIDFYFDFSSPYGYLASQRIEALAAKHGRGVDWHPILLGVVFKADGRDAADRCSAQRRLLAARFRAQRALSRRCRDSTCRRSFPIPSQAPARVVLWQKARDPAVAARADQGAITAPSSPTTSTSPRPTTPSRLPARRGRRGGCAGGDRRPGGQGSAEARGRRRDRARRLRLAVRVRRRRAVLGTRSIRPDRALARDRRVLGNRSMADYTLYCFAQSGNAYKPALALELAGADWAPRFVDYLRRRDAHSRPIASDQRHGRGAGARAPRRSACRSPA